MISDTAVAEIRTDAIRRNLQAIRRRIQPGTPVCAAVKADAYGHGLEQTIPALLQAGVERLAVANLEEALRLRRLGWTKPVLALGPTVAYGGGCGQTIDAMEAVAADVCCTISTIHQVRLLAAAARKFGRRAHVEIQIDSGMGRSGVLSEDSWELITETARYPHAVIDGVYTHFATADEPDIAYARQQLLRFFKLVRRIEREGIPVRAFHAANSAAVFRLPESHLSLVRPGLAVYGYWGGSINDRPDDLFPAMRVVSRLSEVRRLPAGHPVGYGCTFTTRRDSTIGLVPLGYADGYRRLFGNESVVTMLGSDGTKRTAPVIGRVSMDQITVDLTDLGPVHVGDTVIVIDDDPAAPNSVENLARKTNTIPYEITTLLGQRIRRVAVEKELPSPQDIVPHSTKQPLRHTTS